MQTLHTLKRGILLFWALWFSCAWLSNLFDFLKHFEWISVYWVFVSGNFTFVQNVLSIYKLPPIVAEGLFVGVLLWEGIIAFCFWKAFFTYKNLINLQWVNRAFLFSAALWATFLVTEEIFIAYLYEQTHLLLFLAQLICLWVIHALPMQSNHR